MATASLPSSNQPQKQPQKVDDVKQFGTVLLEDIDPADYPGTKLTTDCHFVYHEGGQIDLAKGGMVAIFDHYHDQGIKLSRIKLAGGNRNPKNSKPEV